MCACVNHLCYWCKNDRFLYLSGMLQHPGIWHRCNCGLAAHIGGTESSKTVQRWYELWCCRDGSSPLPLTQRISCCIAPSLDICSIFAVLTGQICFYHIICKLQSILVFADWLFTASGACKAYACRHVDNLVGVQQHCFGVRYIHSAIISVLGQSV